MNFQHNRSVIPSFSKMDNNPTSGNKCSLHILRDAIRIAVGKRKRENYICVFHFFYHREFKITKKAGLLKVRLPEYLFVRTELQQLLTKYGFFRHLDHLIQLYLHYNYQSAQYHNLHQPVNGSTTLPRRPD